MQAGTFPTDAPVVDIRTRVLVNGVERTFESLAWDAEIPGDLPEGVAAGSGIKERTGTIVWAGDPVAVRSPGPWTRVGGWPPRRGDRVEIWDHHGDQSWRRFYGRIDSNSGGLGDPLSSKIVDDWDEFDREAYVEPLLHSAPGRKTGANSSAPGYLSTLTPWGPVYRALESAGKGLLPPHDGARLAASFQGCTLPWPDGGVQDSPRDFPGAMSQTLPGIYYHPGITIGENWEPGRGTSSLSNLAVLLRFPQADVHDRLSEHARVVLELGDAEVAVRCRSSRVVVELDGATVASAPVTYDGGLCTVAMRWAGTDLTIRVDEEEHSFSSVTRVPNRFGFILARCNYLAALQVFTNTSKNDFWGRVASVNRNPYMMRTSDWGFLWMGASRLIVSRSARSVLEEFAAATLYSIWLDEHGVLQLWGSDRLIRSGVARTFTTTMDVLAMSWTEQWDQVRRAARVKFLEASTTAKGTDSVALWSRESAQLLARGETDERFVEPAPDEDWFEPDWTFAPITSQDDMNYSPGSVWGATRTGFAGNEVWAINNVSCFVSRIKGHTIKVTHVASSSTIPAGEGVNLRTHSEDGDLLPRWRNHPLPILRGRGLVTWVDNTRSRVAGPSWASEYEHDMRWWGRPDAAQALADWIAPQLAAPTVTLNSLELAYDPRIQLADMIRVTSDREGFTVTGLVVGIHVGVDADGHSMSLTIRVTAVDHNGATYEQLEAAYAGVGETFQTLETDWSDTDYAGFESNPTGRQ